MSNQVVEKMTADSVRRLLEAQFPQWARLSIEPVKKSIYESQMFRLGNDMSVRLPTSEEYSPQVMKEYEWLPKISPHISVQIPEILGLGQPSPLFPWNWTVRSWIEGESAADLMLETAQPFAIPLAHFLNELHSVSAEGGPAPGFHSFNRGGSVSIFDKEAQEALLKIEGVIDVKAARNIWEKAMISTYNEKPVWVHGDMNSANLLARDGRLAAVIDFGSIAAGDPACDLVMAWTFFDKEGRQRFKKALNRDDGQWHRARGWALFKVLYTIAFNKEVYWPSAQSLFSRIVED